MDMDYIPYDPASVPTSMRNGPDWVRDKLSKSNFSGEQNAGPLHPADGHQSTVSDPSSWRTSETPVAHVGTDGTDDAGNVLDTDDLVGIDQEGVRSPETGVINPGALAIVRRLASYSKTGSSQAAIPFVVRPRTYFAGGNHERL